MAGTVIGLRDLHYALLATDVYDPVTPANTETTYYEPVRVPGIIQANINPNPRISSLFADDGPMETAATLGEIELELSTSNLSLETQAILLGHTITDKKLLKRSSDDTPPWVAIGYRALKSNGEYRYAWLLKGRFMVPERRHETMGAEVTFQTETISGRFVSRDSDAMWIRETDSDDYTTLNEEILEEWFDTVEPGEDPAEEPTGED